MACRAFIRQVIAETQNMTPKKLEGKLERVRKLAIKLSDALEDRSLGIQAAGMLDERLARWPAFAGGRVQILVLLPALSSACQHEQKGLCCSTSSDEGARGALLDRLAAVYERITGRRAGYSSPADANKPGGPFVRFYEAIAAGLLPPEVEDKDPAYAVKNHFEKRRSMRQVSLT